MQSAYEAACRRQPEPRKAVPRQVKEGELKKIVDAFGKSIGLGAGEIARWQKESIGLLNKVLRESRFDNRLKSTCSWCEKKTPKTSKPNVRRMQFEAAVKNIRLHGPGGEIVGLHPDQEKIFLNWWEKRQLQKSGNYKFSNSRSAPLSDRAPTEDNLEKYLAQMEVISSAVKKKGSWVRGFPMLRQLNDLLNHEPRNGRSGLCLEHLEMARQGKTMKDAGVDWQTMKIRRAPNPRREQHDARVLRRIESILFQKGKRGAEAWRHGPVSCITLEIPEPQTKRLAKGEMSERQALTQKQRLYMETGGKVDTGKMTGGICIYTGKPTAVEEMESDHIYPRSRGGPDVFANLVCASKRANKDKDNRLPSEWLKGSQWEEFKSRVEALPALSEAKKKRLLLDPGSEYPEDGTALAHSGARPMQFIQGLIRIFKSYGAEPPVINYETQKPLVQRVSGRWTSELRKSWMFKDNEGKRLNFPEKNRADLYNHAQDAALLAATPPHTWREQILTEEAVRLCVKRDATGQIILKNGVVEKEMRIRPGVAALALAPDWDLFFKNRKVSLVRVLGRTGLRWRTKLLDQSLYQNPGILVESKLKIHKLLDSGAVGLPGQRRFTAKTQKGGLMVRVPCHGSNAAPYRKMQVKPVKSEAVIFWQDAKGKFQISLKKPAAIGNFVKNLIEPIIPMDAKRLGSWKKNQIVLLSASGEHRAGYYRVKELSEVLPILRTAFGLI